MVNKYDIIPASEYTPKENLPTGEQHNIIYDDMIYKSGSIFCINPLTDTQPSPLSTIGFNIFWIPDGIYNASVGYMYVENYVIQQTLLTSEI